MNELILKPMSVKEDQDLYNSLKKGNVQSVTFLKDGEEVKGFIEANPKDRTINIYDAKMEPLSKEARQDFIDHHPGKEKQQAVNGQEAGKEKEQKQEVKETPAAEGDDSPELKKKRTRKQGKGVKL